MDGALAMGKLKDEIVDEHALLLFLEYLGEWPKFNRRGEAIPGTRIGPVSITCDICSEATNFEPPVANKEAHVCRIPNAETPRSAGSFAVG